MVQVVVGKLESPTFVVGECEGKKVEVALGEWQMRSMWSYLRLQHGYKAADAIIKDVGVENAFVLHWQGKRDLQFILEGSGEVIAVATLKHLLIPPEQVYEFGQEIMLRKYKAKGTVHPDLEGMVFGVKEIGGFCHGLQLFGGNILTRNAITITSTLRVQVCFNPLSWLHIGEMMRFVGARTGDWEKVLRVEKITELKPRLEVALDNAMEQLSRLEDRIEVAQKRAVDIRQVRILTAAMGFSYSLGAKTLSQVVNRFMEEQSTLWGLSMAFSWVARNGKVKAAGEDQTSRARQKLSTLAGASILIDKPKTAEHLCVEWLRKHIRDGNLKTADEVLQGVQL